MKNITTKDVEKLLVTLTEEQKQLLKDTINFGFCGSADMEFVEDKTEIKTLGSNGYRTNDAKKAGHFSGRKISAMFRSIYRKLTIIDGMGEFLTHCSNWWDNGTGDMIFIKIDFVEAFECWAKEK